jgi:O-acetyl-ADP-ribose deacetylase (regulator of RNase III)
MAAYAILAILLEAFIEYYHHLRDTYFLHMKIDYQIGNILDVESDALVYSTNLKLLMSGGVGASLLGRYGYDIQKSLYDAFDNGEKNETRLGDIFDCKVESMPWKKVLHSIATDEDYVTDPIIVENIIRDCLGILELSHGVSRISMSALGCGWGNMKHKQFTDILKKVSMEFENTDLEEIVVVCDREEEVASMRTA